MDFNKYLEGCRDLPPDSEKNNLEERLENCEIVPDGKLAKFLRYNFAGFLPGHIQEEIAQKYNEDAFRQYTGRSCVTEATASAAVAMGSLMLGYFPVAGLSLMVGFCAGADMFVRGALGHQLKEKGKRPVPLGSLLVTIPYYMVKVPYKIIKKLS